MVCRSIVDSWGGAPLNYEVDGAWGSTNRVWVQVPAFSNGVCFYAMWGSKVAAHADSQTNGAVWSEHYEGVWHLNDQTFEDATSHERDGSSGNPPANDEGIVGGGQLFDGSNDRINISGYKGVTGKNPRTISLWVSTPNAVAPPWNV